MGAKFTGKDIQPDEFVQPLLDFDYDGKRDRWNGYNPEWHQEIVDEYARVEEVININISYNNRLVITIM